MKTQVPETTEEEHHMMRERFILILDGVNVNIRKEEIAHIRNGLKKWFETPGNSNGVEFVDFMRL